MKSGQFLWYKPFSKAIELGRNSPGKAFTELLPSHISTDTGFSQFINLKSFKFPDTL
jgi:hypothetical protein